jgi:hypothetical protein
VSGTSGSACGGVVEEVAEFPLHFVFPDAFKGVFADGGLGAVDVAVVEVFEAGGEPLFLAVQQDEYQGPGEGVQVLAGVVEVPAGRRATCRLRNPPRSLLVDCAIDMLRQAPIAASNAASRV